MGNDLKEKYYVKKDGDDYYHDITDLFDGLRILKMDGFLSKGKPVNIFTQQWVDEQNEDFLITTKDGNGNDVVVRENTDIEITFIIKQKYATEPIDVKCVHDSFIEYMTNSDLWLCSYYANETYAHCICLKEYAPTISRLHRGSDSWIMGTLTLHTLEAPTQRDD